MFKAFTSVFGGAAPELPADFDPAGPYAQAWGGWQLFRGTAKADGGAASVFRLQAKRATDATLDAGRNGVKRLKLLRHPNVLSFKDSHEAEEPNGGVTLLLVTEPVTPLADKLKELNLQGAARDEYIAWGLQQVATAVSFLNNDAKLVHGNVSLSSVMVTDTLDWKLAAFDLLSELDALGEGSPEGLVKWGYRVADQYKPEDVRKNDFATVRASPPWAVDAWGLGCLIQEVFSGKPLARTEELRNTDVIPQVLLREYQRLLGSQPARRLNPSKLVSNGAFFENKLVESIRFLENLTMKDTAEKESYFRRLPAAMETLPKPIVQHKVLPILTSALEFGSAPALALPAMLAAAQDLPAEEYQAKIVPTLVKLFASPDRQVRVTLLQSLDSFAEHLSPAIVDEQVYPNVANGFGDTTPFLRELTLKSMLTLIPKISQRNINSSLLKYLAKLQVDEEPAIRANTTICLGNIWRHLSEASCKRVLLNAFTRALRDSFPPARVAGLMALKATMTQYDVQEAATRVLPAASMLTVDIDGDVRKHAFVVLDAFTGCLRDHARRMTEAAAAGEPVPQNAPLIAGAGGAASAADSNSGSNLLWAAGSLASRLMSGSKEKDPLAAPSPAASPAKPDTKAYGSAPGVAAARAPPSPPAVAAAAAAAPPASSSFVGMDDDADAAGDADGWGDMDDDDLGLEDPEEAAARARLSAPRTAATPAAPSGGGGGMKLGASKLGASKLGASKLGANDDWASLLDS